MKTIKAGIVDDEIQNIKIIQHILEKQCEKVIVAFTADNIEDARRCINENEVDVVFMDIEMPPYSSFELLQSIEQTNFKLIFVTAHQEYALQAIKMAAMDYILKPIKTDDIIQVISKVRKKDRFHELTGMMKEYLHSQTAEGFSKIVVHATDGYNVVDIQDILYIEALDSYSRLKLLKNETHVSSRSLKEFDELLTDKGFYRVHKSYLVNFRHILKIIKGTAPSIIMSNGAEIPISTRKKEQFFTELKGVISF